MKNAVRCKHCGEVIESRSVHDFKWCKCEAVAVDGGKCYLKRSANSMDDFEELSVVTDDDEDEECDKK